MDYVPPIATSLFKISSLPQHCTVFQRQKIVSVINKILHQSFSIGHNERMTPTILNTELTIMRLMQFVMTTKSVSYEEWSYANNSKMVLTVFHL